MKLTGPVPEELIEWAKNHSLACRRGIRRAIEGGWGGLLRSDWGWLAANAHDKTLLRALKRRFKAHKEESLLRLATDSLWRLK